MGEFDHDVCTPRLSGDDGAIESERIDQQLEVVGDGGHVETVIGFVAAPVSALVDGHNGVAERSKVTSHPVPQSSIRGEAMYENERCFVRNTRFAPKEAMKGEVAANGDHFAARCRHVSSFARRRLNGTMEAR